MKPIPLIQSSQLKPFTSALDRLGAPTDKLLEQCSIYPDVLESAHQYIPEFQLVEFILLAGRSQGNPLDFAFSTGRDSHIEEYSPLGQYLAPSLTLRELLERFCCYVRFYSTQANFWVSSSSEEFWFCRSGVRDIDIGRDVSEAYTLMLMINLIRSVLGDRWYPTKVYLQMRPNSDIRSYGKLGDAEVVFDCDTTIVSLERDRVDSHFSGWKTHVTAAGTVASLTTPPKDFVDSLAEVILPLLHHRQLRLSNVAGATGLSSRTLQRHLSKCGLTYGQLVDRVRFDRARELMQDPNLQLGSVAEALGYSSPAHFTRAFQRWTGSSPSNFRQSSTGNIVG